MSEPCRNVPLRKLPLRKVPPPLKAFSLVVLAFLGLIVIYTHMFQL